MKEDTTDVLHQAELWQSSIHEIEGTIQFYYDTRLTCFRLQSMYRLDYWSIWMKSI